MRTEKSTAPAGTDTMQTLKHNQIISFDPKNVKNALKRWRLRNGKTAEDAVEIVKSAFPQYDKFLHSKCENTDATGVELCAGAFDLLKATESPLKGENRKTPCRVVVRLTQADFDTLQHAQIANGYGTRQEFVSQILRRYLKGYRKRVIA